MKALQVMAGRVVLTGCVVLASTVLGGNLLTNPGFEAGTGDGWNFELSAYTAAAVNGSAKHTGDYGLITSTTVGWLDYTSYVTIGQSVPVTAAGNYMFSVWQNANTDAARISLRVSWYDVSNTPLSSTQVDFGDHVGSWIQRDLPAVAPALAASAKVEVVSTLFWYGERSVNIDDATFGLVPEPTSLSLLGVLAGAWGLLKRHRMSYRK